MERSFNHSRLRLTRSRGLLRGRASEVRRGVVGGEHTTGQEPAAGWKLARNDLAVLTACLRSGTPAAAILFQKVPPQLAAVEQP